MQQSMIRISGPPTRDRIMLVFVGLVSVLLALLGVVFDPLSGAGFSKLLGAVAVPVLLWGLITLVSMGFSREVYDGGDHLLFLIGDKKRRVPLSEIEDISYPGFVRYPKVVTIETKGGNFCFAPLINPGLFSTPPIVEELKDRVYAARFLPELPAKGPATIAPSRENPWPNRGKPKG